MVKTVSTYSKGLGHFNPAKPITHGLKVLALCDRDGYCLTSSVDGGFKGDPGLRPFGDHPPLGKTARHVLHVLLEECKTLKEKLVGSGVFIAMDNYFTSPTLFACLASQDIFAVGTCRPTRTSGADPYMESLGRATPNRGDMSFCRSGDMAFVQWHDSKEIFLCSTIHIGETGEERGGVNHFRPVPLALKGKGEAGKHRKHDAPPMRMDYVRNMGGVDRADQQNAAHYHDKKSCTNHWRRVFDAKIMQMLTNNFLTFRMWVRLLMGEVEKEMEASDDMEEWEELAGVKNELERLSKIERAVWDEQLSEILMKRCNVGKRRKGGRAPRSSDEPLPTKAVWGSVVLKSARKCMNPECQSRTSKGCTCEEFCTWEGQTGVLMCKKCFLDKERHAAAAEATWHGVDVLPSRSQMAWLGVS